MKTNGHFQEPENGIYAFQEGALLRMYFDFEKCEVAKDEEGNEIEGAPKDLYNAYNVDVVSPFSYGNIVSAIVNDKYTADDVQALQANYIEAKDAESDISAEKREEYLAEWQEFQAWRAKAKDIAVTVLAQIKTV